MQAIIRQIKSVLTARQNLINLVFEAEIKSDNTAKSSNN
jgi:hypothetical protein